MLTEKQLQEIRDHLEKAQNPIFFFDNDADGLTSFLQLRKYIGRGKGVPVKGNSELPITYFRKIHELNADYIFILDKPVVSKEFFDEVEKINLPIVWIDHHDLKLKIPKFVDYYNSFLNKKSKKDFYNNQTTAEPVSYISYRITNKKEDIWLAIAGCIADRFFPDIYGEFMKKYPDLGLESENPFDIFYKSKIGKMGDMFNFALKDRITNVVIMMKFLIKVKSPYDVFEETQGNYIMRKRYEELNLKYQKILEKGKKLAEESNKLLFFKFGGDMSISCDVANGLGYLYRDKIVVVAYDAGYKANISMRGDNVRRIVLKAIEGLENATGGGHRDAVGASVRMEDLDEFKKRVEKLI